MKSVFQTKNGKPDGNCFQAAVASVFELELDEVPDFYQSGSEWWDKYREWCMDRGYIPIYISQSDLHDESVLAGYYIMKVETERGLPHSVVGRGGQIVHDPFPGGSVITKVLGYDLFVSLMAHPHIGGERCQSCGRLYDLVWDAPTELWRAVVEKGDGGLNCPDCFDRACREKGIFLRWTCDVDREVDNE